MGFKFLSGQKSTVTGLVDPGDGFINWKPTGEGVHAVANFQMARLEGERPIRVAEASIVQGISYIEGCGGMMDGKEVRKGQRGRNALGVEYEGT